MKVGFMGLGIMGSRMAKNVLKAGHELQVFNRSKNKAEVLLGEGAQWADSPATLVTQSDILITMLAHPEAVEEVALGETGFLKQAGQNKLWMDCSTVHPSFSQKMATKATQAGYRFLDAPVVGTKGPAENGELVFLVGGDKADLEQAQPLMDVMGKKTLHLGGHGKGSSMKMIVNMMLAQTMLAFSEGLSLGQALGIEQKPCWMYCSVRPSYRLI